ncbi:hypothetical protein AVEN_66189-1 [Araneus ventricosus]|uniref:Uncharacterized protein n=1 Tax=Araneus ventricosus TaxID=182803 RepID=A0A4Y2LG06_ARAVE|nr:hypothetical protein AVEN_66189-1 [Araneus ventricosus]
MWGEKLHEFMSGENHGQSIPGMCVILSAELGHFSLQDINEKQSKITVLSDELLQVVDPVMQRNAFFALPENVLLAMLVYEREHIWELGYRMILKARQIVTKKKTVRNFVPPNINFQASDYFEIINWNSYVEYPPPMLRDLSEDVIKSLSNSDTTPIKEIQKFPCHTHSVEKCAKLVTEASNKV